MNLSELASIAADEAKAVEMVERLRWPSGPVCPHCGATDRIYDLRKTRLGLRKCGHCRKQFTVRVGSIFEDSPIPLRKWLLAIHLMCSSKKGISANQLKRELGLSYQSAWFLCHRVRLAMTQEPLTSLLGANGIVEVDETFCGGKVGNNLHRDKTPAAGKKTIVLTLVDRDGDAVGVVVPDTKKETLEPLIKPLVDRSAMIVTDGNPSYADLDSYFHSHYAVDHDKQFVRAMIIHTNFAESYHSLLKRGLFGAFHHVSAEHLHRYVSEFSFRWNTRKMTDGARTERAIAAAAGRRLTYKPLTTH
ncbi:MAG: IS1595 family transposase [Methylocella sp.]